MNRTAAIVVAAVVALLSGTGLFLYVSQADARAASGEELVPVLVTAAEVPAGTFYEDAVETDLLVTEEVPRRLIPPTAVGDPSALAGMRATMTVPQGLVVVAEMFSAEDPESGPVTLARKIPDDRVAVTFSAGTQAAVADLIAPGDQVSLIIKTDGAAGGEGRAALPSIPEDEPAVVHIFQNLEVFAIGQVPVDDAAEEPVLNPGGGLYTVLVDPADAARLIYLTTEYDVFLVLAPPGYEARELPIITGANAMPEGLTPGKAEE